jgi:serine/threonine protein kinase
LPVLELIHNNNIIHRDIKLDNIMRRDDGKLVLIDFGVAKQFVDR